MKFKNVSILLPAMNETYSLEQSVEIILKTCKDNDILEIIVLLSKKSTKECIEMAQKIKERYPQKIIVHYQTMPFVGGACREGFELARGSHVVLMSSDLETDPHLVCKFIEEEKHNPDGIVTASRWMKGCSFEGYSKVKWICNFVFQASVYKGYKRDEIEMRGDRAEMSDFPLYLNTVAGGLDCRNQAIGGFSFVVKIYALPVVEIIGQFLYLLGRYGFDAQIGYCF